MGQFEKLKGKLTKSPDNLLRGLELSDRAVAEMMRHAVYLYLRYATNTRDTASRDAQTQMFALPNFYIDRTEVTNEAYARCVADGKCPPPTSAASS